MKIAYQTSRAGDVESGIIVSFKHVVTVPVVIDGKQAVAYIGVGPLTPNPANPQQLSQIARALSAGPDWLCKYCNLHSSGINEECPRCGTTRFDAETR